MSAPAGETRRSSKAPPRPVELDWEQVSDAELLGLRVCDLPIRLEGSKVEERVRLVQQELDSKGLLFHPPCYLADEWFSPEGDPVIGIPFYLAHPRLVRLEKSMVMDAEGESRSDFLELLRHEVGHALSHAYKLRERRDYRRVFGPHTKPYPEAFRPRPYSRQFVHHLDDWYAQTHPDEDFAETFAVWLDPESGWRERYKGWGALKKLEFVERLMGQTAGKPPKKRRGERMCRLSALRYTLDTYYKRKRKAYEEDFPDFFDRDLQRIFTDGAGHGEPASRFLRRHRPMLVRCISQWTTEKRFTVRGLVQRFADRCQELELRVHRPEAETMAQVVSCLTAMASNYFLLGKFKRPR